MSRHERGRNRIADVILPRAADTASDLQQGAVIPNQEDQQILTVLPFMIDTLGISIGEEHENSRIKPGHSPFKRGAHVGKRLGGLDRDMFDGDTPDCECWRGWIGFARCSHGSDLYCAH
jgi:hypothetical protein